MTLILDTFIPLVFSEIIGMEGDDPRKASRKPEIRIWCLQRFCLLLNSDDQYTG